MGRNAHGAYKCTCHIHENCEQLFSNMLDSGMAVFLDDILVYSGTIKEHFMLF